MAEPSARSFCVCAQEFSPSQRMNRFVETATATRLKLGVIASEKGSCQHWNRGGKLTHSDWSRHKV